MIAQTSSFYDLLGVGLGGVSYQEFINTMLSDKYNRLDTPGFLWDNDIQMDFTYHQIQAQLGLYSMATGVDIDSPSVYKSTDGVEISSGSIPRFKHGYAINEKILREQMLIALQTERYSTGLQDKMLRILFNHSDKLLGGNHNTVTFQRHQMVSKGKYELLDINNPSGLQNISFFANVPDENRTELSAAKRWFTDANGTEGAESDPIKNLKDKVKEMKAKGLNSGFHFETSLASFDEFIGHSKVRQIAGLTIQPLADPTQATAIGRNMDDAQLKAIIERKIGAPITVIDSVAVVERWDKVTGKTKKTQLDSFDKNMWVLVPDGSLGTIKAVQPIVVPDPSARIAFFDGGRTVLKQTFNSKENIQYIESELTCLVVPDKPQYMLYLKVA